MKDKKPISKSPTKVGITKGPVTITVPDEFSTPIRPRSSRRDELQRKFFESLCKRTNAPSNPSVLTAIEALLDVLGDE